MIKKTTTKSNYLDRCLLQQLDQHLLLKIAFLCQTLSEIQTSTQKGDNQYE